MNSLESHQNFLHKLEERVAALKAAIKKREEEEMVQSSKTSMNRASGLNPRSYASSKPASTSEFCCNRWACTECERCKKASTKAPKSAAKEHLPTLYTKPLCPQATPQEEKSYICDTEDNFLLMMPLLNCEREGCARCYPAGIILPPGHICDTILGVLTWLWAPTSEEEHLNMCRFQVERKCRKVE